MKKITSILALTVLILLTNIKCKAQGGPSYNPPDSSGYFAGYWTNINLVSMKDSVAPFSGKTQNYVKIWTPNLQFTRFGSSRNDGTPTSILWADNNGFVNKSPLSSVVSTPTITPGVTRSLNTTFTVSTTNNATVYYGIRISYSVTALLGSTGSATLQYSTNGGTTWQSYPSISNNINLGLALSGYNDFLLSGDIPKGAIVKIVTSASNATVTFNSGSGVEKTY